MKQGICKGDTVEIVNSPVVEKGTKAIVTQVKIAFDTKETLVKIYVKGNHFWAISQDLRVLNKEGK